MNIEVRSQSGLQFSIEDCILFRVIELIECAADQADGSEMGVVLFSGRDLSGRRIVNFGTNLLSDIKNLDVVLLDGGGKFSIAISQEVASLLQGRSLVQRPTGFEIV